ncbi:C40 family peptidase [Caldimonas tepidiphila]|uniref:C40 family peptidase n=1 Tax=Caldimonas tepidiphila TaxID=2315841 RepID=UPI001F0C9413|nr:C40 family peptidase [Caldimonas tepidiphila]
MSHARRPSRFSALLSVALCVAALGGSPSSAWSAPTVNEEAIKRFLAERGLAAEAPLESEAPAGERGLMQQMRETASDMVMTAMGFLGVPYRRGGDSAEEGFDCSGFTRFIFERSIGLVLPRRADDQASAAGLVAVQRDELKPGDLVFFNTLRRTFSHVGIYVGEGKFIHSPRTGAKVRVEDMRAAYWTKRYTGARRVGAAGDAAQQGESRAGGQIAGQSSGLKAR